MRLVTIPLAPLAARGNDMRGATDFGPRGGKATARRLKSLRRKLLKLIEAMMVQRGQKSRSIYQKPWTK
jgi:hypothetical protein